jgi:hypothetical protein
MWQGKLRFVEETQFWAYIENVVFQSPCSQEIAKDVPNQWIKAVAVNAAPSRCCCSSVFEFPHDIVTSIPNTVSTMPVQVVLYDAKHQQGVVTPPISIHNVLILNQGRHNNGLFSINNRNRSWVVSQLLGYCQTPTSPVLFTPVCTPSMLKPESVFWLYENQFESISKLLEYSTTHDSQQVLGQLAATRWEWLATEIQNNISSTSSNDTDMAQKQRGFWCLLFLMSTQATEQQRICWLSMEHRLRLQHHQPRLLPILLEGWGAGITTTSMPTLDKDSGAKRKRTTTTKPWDVFAQAVGVSTRKLEDEMKAVLSAGNEPGVVIGIDEPRTPWQVTISNTTCFTNKTLIAVLPVCHSYHRISTLLEPLTRHGFAVITPNNSIVVPASFLYRFLPTYCYFNVMHYTMPNIRDSVVYLPVNPGSVSLFVQEQMNVFNSIIYSI